MSTRLSGKNALITGGSSGIGRGIAKRFLAEGAQVAVIGRDERKLEELKKETNNKLQTIQGDVTNHERLKDMIRLTKDKLGSIDTLVCSAGIGYRLPLRDANLQEFDRTFSVNVRAIFDMIRIMEKELSRGNSSILLISSIAGHVTFTDHVIYSAAKAAITKMTANFSIDLAESSIRVNAISPGFIKTPIFDHRLKQDPDFFKKLGSAVPLKRMGLPEDIANAATFLCSNEASYITGVDLVVDGGYMHQGLLPMKKN
ncbi:2-(R)-hydroxypropyl-CoM dehydrogenase [Synechococcus sp. MIT S9509]|uniref:SDR family NAD(P)-dependent oxidoreductase n=1 Tax=unclassified Synechococcus TaxID=2626047 RepID=UPI0007BBBC20|nr:MULTISPECIES: SDR family oxidoreductase [unclassified Synechococcus]KZR80706.1 2-(R)-hydroxypropyl-CoM dehydrogenase [Synechococcus sp. MIT S9504]KZR85788.1 2-(R)-hydroxypropyl-CoM dehydrogenase [Synechococcus sp. MIT S9509]